MVRNLHVLSPDTLLSEDKEKRYAKVRLSKKGEMYVYRLDCEFGHYYEDAKLNNKPYGYMAILKGEAHAVPNLDCLYDEFYEYNQEKIPEIKFIDNIVSGFELCFSQSHTKPFYGEDEYRLTKDIVKDIDKKGRYHGWQVSGKVFPFPSFWDNADNENSCYAILDDKKKIGMAVICHVHDSTSIELSYEKLGVPVCSW